MAIKVDYFPGLKFQQLSEDNMAFGVLSNANSTYAVPTVNNFAFFNEHDFYSHKLIEEKCTAIKKQLEENASAYELFVRQKGRRPSYDIYAGFQPFNEAFKAFFPFIKILKKRLEPGDIILNLWDRTGWTAVLLAGLFPEQKVINIWEGDREALGYKGFQFWYGKDNAAQHNLQFVFADLDQALPFADHSIGLVIGFDAFHRFDQSNLLTELFRIVKQDSAILFPHVHLSNAEPDPFFERGCRQLHGLDYDAFFQKSCANSGRKGYVFPEPKMFSFNELGNQSSQPIQSQPDTHHYNAMIALLPADWEKTEQLQTFRFDDYENWQNCRVLINPLLDINLHQNDVRQNPELRAGRVGYLLERHPIYLKKLVIQTTLSEEESIVLYWAERLLTIAEIADQSHIPITEIQRCLKRLYQLDIIQLVPIAADHLRLQYFVSTQNYCLPAAEKNVAALWHRAVRLFGTNTYIWSELDDSELSYQECDDLIQLIKSAYQQSGLVNGDHVALICANHFEAILASLAAMQMGLVVIPIDSHLAVPIQQHILSETSPKLVISSVQHNTWLKDQDYNTVYLDEEEEPHQGTLFSEWLEEKASEEPLSQSSISSNQPACILYTSGSTGIPKGVVLNHDQLVSSGRLITETFHWQADSRFFSPGELDSMSGFRNHLIAPLEVGAGIIIAKAEHKAHLFSLLECMTTYQASILGTTPALLGQLLQFPKRSKPAIHQLTTIICTGSNLSPQLKMDFHTTFGLVPLNYYGLTETTGICLAESPDNYLLDQNTVGIPRNCIAQIVNNKGQLVATGTEGDLRIYSENCTWGYYKQKDKTAALIRRGWLYTGDRALQQQNGHIALLGRTRDIIKTASGQLVFAAEVENSIRQVNHLVSAAAVVGVVEQGDEKIIAFVVLKPDLSLSEQDLRQELKLYLNENIGQRKTPTTWHFVDQLPINSSGKVIKQTLIDQHNQNKDKA